MFHKPLLAGVVLAVASATLADPLPSKLCVKGCFEAGHVCGRGQVLVPPTGAGGCFLCCLAAPPPDGQEFCAAVCLPADFVCPDGRPLAGANGCFNCCGPKA
ncbi:hypothetical protein PC9H_002274 [Pleurotus ostreatus]|uniref:Small cysteine-rich protein n=1 Tax=Pleurotus ostreatus TaxID=5322 RepID=A0A8H6ZKL1_PLEOS|nr:uncharacterized protein PC9H_002274 [Pleurotus ostreatus]KAF7419682.1 hypothetical protein PC9H_002274 [Pleurotus ostreatus]